MTEEQANEIILYLDAINQLLLKLHDLQLYIFIILSILGGLFIGIKVGGK